MVEVGDYVYCVEGTRVDKLYVWDMYSAAIAWVQFADEDGDSDKWLVEISKLFATEAEALDAAIVEAEDLVSETFEKIRSLREKRRRLYV